MLETVKRAFRLPELRNKIFFTLFIFIVFRFGTFIPVPGMDREAIKNLVQQGGFLGLLDLFSGGGFGNFSIFALGVLPYINASIIIQLLGSVIPALERLMKEGGEEGRKAIARYTRYLTLLLAVLQSTSLLIIFRNYITSQALFDKIVVIATLVAGAYIVLWLGEIITEKGIGNGVSLIIFAGIVSRIPVGIVQAISLMKVGALNVIGFIAGIIGSLVLVAGVLYAYQAERKVPVQYAKRIVGRKVYGGQATYIPLKLIQAGVLPIIFASVFIMFPSTVGSFWPNSWFTVNIAKPLATSTTWVYNVTYFFLIIFFTYFYTEITYNPEELSDNLKKYGGFIPGVRPGKPTADHIKSILNRVVLPTSIFLAFIAIVPNLAMRNIQIQAFVFGGTSLLIIIGVALETVREIEAYLLMRHHKGFLS